jgi:signal transduction histidine kinase
VERRSLILDALAALGFALLPQVAALQPTGTPDPRAGLLLAAAALPIAVRRLWPVPVFLVVLGLSGAAAVFSLGPASFLAAGFALYPVAATRQPRRWYSPMPVAGAAVTVAVGLVAIGTPAPGGFPAGQLVLGMVVLALGWAAGRAVSERRDRAARATTETVARARAEERLAIARELHDVVTHGVGLIAVKAGVANHVADEQPQEARAALQDIETMSRTALREMRTMLTVLRGDGAAAAGLRPPPRLSDLCELAKSAEAAGVRVELCAPSDDTVPEGVALSAFRIVQEALTNVVRHAAPTRCRVTVAAEPDRVRIQVDDDGPETPRHQGRGDQPRGAGLGIVGMRERALAHAGSFAAGPRPGKGFTVSAVLPY